MTEGSERQRVGWAKSPGANASGGVPTIAFAEKTVGTALARLCPPYGLRACHSVDERAILPS